MAKRVVVPHTYGGCPSCPVLLELVRELRVLLSEAHERLSAVHEQFTQERTALVERVLIREQGGFPRQPVAPVVPREPVPAARAPRRLPRDVTDMQRAVEEAQRRRFAGGIGGIRPMPPPPFPTEPSVGTAEALLATQAEVVGGVEAGLVGGSEVPTTPDGAEE